MTKQYRSKVLAAIYETAGDLHDAGAISGRTMKAFDDVCLTPVKPLTEKPIRPLRIRR